MRSGDGPGAARSSSIPGVARARWVWGVGVIVALALLLAVPALSLGTSSAGAGRTVEAPHDPAEASSPRSPHLARPDSSGPNPFEPASFASAASSSHARTTPSSFGRIVTVDNSSANNYGVFTDLDLPSGALAPGVNWTLSIAEPINATAAVEVGIEGVQAGAKTLWNPFYVLWNVEGVPGPVEVHNLSWNLTPGNSVTMGFGQVEFGTLTDSPWWSLYVDGRRITTPGTNGTIDLGTSRAAGFAPSGAPFQSPTFEMLENGSAAPPPSLTLSTALSYVPWVPGVGYDNFIPSDGIWLTNATGWGIAGEDQNSQLYMGQADVGSSSPTGLPALANGTWLWGFGGPAIHTIANMTVDPAGVFPNTGIRMTINLTDPATLGPNATSYLVTVWERLAYGIEVGIGALVNGPSGYTIPYFVTNFSGEVVNYIGDQVLQTGGQPLTFSIIAIGQGNWTFLVGESQIKGVQTENSTVDLFVDQAQALPGSTPFLTVATVGALPPAGLTDLPLDTSISVRESGVWIVPKEGLVANTTIGCAPSCPPAPLQGYEQSPWLGPGEIVISGSGTPLPVGTVLWDGLTFPTLAVNWTGVPSSAGSLSTTSARLWVNGTTGPIRDPSIELRLPSGVSSGPVWFPWQGGAALNLSFPIEAGSYSTSLLAYAAAPGYEPGLGVAPVVLSEGNTTVQGHLAAAEAAPFLTYPVVVWVNGTDGAPPQTGATVDVFTSLGGSITAPSYDPTVGAFVFNYTAPSVTAPSRESLSVDASEVGFWTSGTVISFPVTPYSLSVAVRATPDPVQSGLPLELLAWVNSTHGQALSGATLSLAFGRSPLPPSVPSSALAPGVYLINTTAPTVTANLTEALVVEASVPGYGIGAISGSLSVVIVPLALRAVAGPETNGIFAIEVQVESLGAPLAFAQVMMTFAFGSSPSQQLSTSSSGNGTFYWEPPSGQSGAFTVSVTATKPGYETRTVQVTLSVAKASTPFGISTPYWLALAPLLVIAVFLLLIAIGRRRAGGVRPPLIPSASRELPPETPEEPRGAEEGGGKGPATASGPAKGSGEGGPTEPAAPVTPWVPLESDLPQEPAGLREPPPDEGEPAEQKPSDLSEASPHPPPERPES